MSADLWRPGWTQPVAASPVSGDAVAAARLLGTVLPLWQVPRPWGWQQHAWALILDRTDGRPRYPSAAIVICRQNGKTTALYPLCWHWLRSGRRVLMALHERKLGAEKWGEIAAALSMVDQRRYRVRRTIGRERVTDTATGGFLALVTPDDAGGRSDTADVLLIDEAAHIRPDFVQAAAASMLTRPDAQMVMISSGLTAESTEMAAVIDRAAAETADDAAERTAGTLIWSASAPPGHDGLDLDDRGLWHAAIPTLGLPGGARPEAVAAARADLPDAVFAREFLSVATATATTPPITATMWDRCRIEGPIERASLESAVIGVDVSPAQTSGAIAVAGRVAGRVVAALLSHGDGDGWLAGDLLDAARAVHPLEIAVDGLSPGSAVMPQMEQSGWQMHRTGPEQMARCCALLFSRVSAAAIQIVADDALTSAAVGAIRRPIADVGWAWHRRHGTGLDITPLVALSLAVGRCAEYSADGDAP